MSQITTMADVLRRNTERLWAERDEEERKAKEVEAEIERLLRDEQGQAE